jgi:hypothetical protein
VSRPPASPLAALERKTLARFLRHLSDAEIVTLIRHGGYTEEVRQRNGLHAIDEKVLSAAMDEKERRIGEGFIAWIRRQEKRGQS